MLASGPDITINMRGEYIFVMEMDERGVTTCDDGVGSFRVNPRFHPTSVGWNPGINTEISNLLHMMMGLTISVLAPD